MRVKRLPTILALHLKRFKYVEQYNRHIKVRGGGTDDRMAVARLSLSWHGGCAVMLSSGVAPCGVPARAPPVQHERRRGEPGPDVRLGGRGHPLRFRAQQVHQLGLVPAGLQTS